jgi:formate hydrogenlyase subunit 6/NADH:ubiquinone oxidoreductase subunit I
MNVTTNTRAQRMTFWEKLYLPEIVKGLGSTFATMFKPDMTRQYPEVRWEPTGSYRGRPVLVQEEAGERCVACGLCSRVCPALAIEVQAGETQTRDKERYPALFEINMLRCIYCGYCEEVCPTLYSTHKKMPSLEKIGYSRLCLSCKPVWNFSACTANAYIHRCTDATRSWSVALHS